MPVSKLGSNRSINSTCVFGSMAGLNSTVGHRSSVTGIKGFKYNLAGRQNNNGCGFNRGCEDGKRCIKSLGKR